MWIRLLRFCLYAIYLFAILSAIASMFIFFEWQLGEPILLSIGSTEIENTHWSFLLVAILASVSQVLFVLMIYELRRIAQTLDVTDEVRDRLLHLRFRKAGAYCIIGSLLNRIPAYLYYWKYKSTFHTTSEPRVYSISYNLGVSYDSMLFLFSIGIFLLLISEIVRTNNALKEENDLTI